MRRALALGLLLALALVVAAPASAQAPLTSNYVRMVGANVGTSPRLEAFGTDTNISILLVPKGTGSVQLGTGGTGVNLTDANGNAWIAQTPSADAVNRIAVANAPTAQNPTITAAGTDTNIGLQFTAKGTGPIRFQSGSSSANNIHVEYRGTGTAPTVGTCGTGSIAAGSSDTAGDVTATGATACTITFGMEWTFQPFCFTQNITSEEVSRVSSISTTAFTVTGLVSGDRFLYHCKGRF